MELSTSGLKHAVARRITHSAQVEIFRAIAGSILVLCIAVAAFAAHLGLASAVAILLLATVISSIHWGVIQGTAVSLTAVGCLDFLFTQPLFKFSVYSRQNTVALVTFEITALLVSRLSWKERLHAQEQERQRQGISKLYRLSNAILLVESHSFALEQVAALIREFFSVESVALWVPQEGRPPAILPQAQSGGNSAHRVFHAGRDEDSAKEGWSHRVLRMGTTPIGGMVLSGWNVDPTLADAAASLIAIAIERSRSAQKENRAEAARNTEQLRAAVLDALAHGFKTPLTAIQTASSGLLAIGGLEATQTELVEIIDEEVTKLANLTTRLLQTAALDAKEIRVRSSKVSLLPLVEEMVSKQAEDTRRRINVARPACLEEIEADSQLLTLALAQLIDNAAKYSSIGSEIEVSFLQDEAKTVITVSNEGEPFRGEELDRIFERYYRGAQAGKGPTGTGLGLSIVKKIAEAHGGDATASWQGDQINVSLSLPGGRRFSHG